MSYESINEMLSEDDLESYPPILTPKDVMEILGIGEKLLYQLLNSGELPGKRIGKKIWRVSKQQLILFLSK